MKAFIDAIRVALAAETGLDPSGLKLESPRNPKQGDLAFPCFQLAKERKLPPPKIAAELAPTLEARLERIEVQAAGPYLNFIIDRPSLVRSVIEEISEQGKAYGHSDEGAGKTVIVDLSSPNIAKPMSVGHLRSTVIGAAIQRLHNALGYTTVGINHIGDWGSQFGKLVAALDRWGDTVDLEGAPIESLLALYVRYHQEEADDPELVAEGQAAFRELESGVDGHVRQTWRKLTELSLLEFDKIYARLGVSFDVVRGEAYYEDHLDKTIERIVAAGVTEQSDGALVVQLDEFGDLPPSLLRKSDGTTLYATRDLAAAFHRHELYQFHRCLYVVGGDQRLHFKQLKLVLQRMQTEWEPRMEHIPFGMMRLPEGKMSTRKGRVVFLDDVLDQAVAEAKRTISAKNPDLANADAIAEQVGVGAVVFNDLKRERVKDIDFNLEELLSFEGDTGPYVQYTYARLGSIAAKAAAAGEGDADPDWSALAQASPLVLRLAAYPDTLRRAAEKAEPSLLTQYLLGLCREANSWSAAERVLGQEPGVTSARLALAGAVRTVASNGLELLGVAAPEQM